MLLFVSAVILFTILFLIAKDKQAKAKPVKALSREEYKLLKFHERIILFLMIGIIVLGIAATILLFGN
jgi:hypothetical protein